MRTYLWLICLLFQALQLSAQTLTIHVSNIRSTEGIIKIQLFNSSENFDNEKPMVTRTFSKKDAVKGALTLALSGIKPGLYGAALLDDENSNAKMDYGLVLPKEGFGFSDYYHTGMKRPVFSQFDFILGNEPKRVEIKIRYL